MTMRRAYAGYQAANLRPMASLSLLATVAIYLLAILSDAWLLPAIVMIAPILPLLLLALVISRTDGIRALDILSLISVVFAEVAINVAGMGLAHGMSWATPGCFLLPVVTSVFWPSRQDFLIAMAITAFGPLPMFLMRQDGGLALLQFAVYMGGAITLATMMYAVMERTLRRQLHLESQLRTQATIDGLTGVLLRNHFLHRAQQALDTYHARGKPVCVAYMDTDRFKQLNDQHGHAAGDAALTGLADCLRAHLRAKDLVGRVGGEEFAMLLPGLDLHAARKRVEAMQVAARSVLRPDGPLTLSIGLAQSHGAGEAIFDLLVRAENAMRHAKKSGRDRIVTDERLS